MSCVQRMTGFLGEVCDKAMIGFDWGTSTLRVYRLGPQGGLIERREAPLGISKIAGGDFAGACGDIAGDWLALHETVVLAGMIGSRQGWREAPYVACPADVAAIAAACIPVDLPGGGRGHIVPGVMSRDAGGVPDVMRGEETQIVGLLRTLGDGPASLCLPGTHSKWVSIDRGRITGFRTYFTGEMFDLIGNHSMLARVFTDGPDAENAFDAGMRRAAAPGGLLHHVFGIRAAILAGDLPAGAGRAFLSGLLVGHEIAAEAPSGTVHLLGGAALAKRYSRALARAGIDCIAHGEDVTARGLWEIGCRIG